MKPLIGVLADRRDIAGHLSHLAGEKYLLGVTDFAGGIPMVLPALQPHQAMTEVLDHLDGLLVPGAYSNIEPHHYGQAPLAGDETRDPWRDATNLELIPAAIRRGIPLLGICRGLQELNVALGGSLYQRVHQQSNRLDHREDPAGTLDERYGPAHPVEFMRDGLLAGWTGRRDAIVNSVHGQGVDRLAPGLAAEARAPDGLIEAVSAPFAPGFVFAVQWHPEWKTGADAVSVAIFEAFGAACCAYAMRRHGEVPGQDER